MKNIFSFCLFFTFSVCLQAQFLEKQKDLVKNEGFFNFYYSQEKDEIYLEVDTLETEFLYVHSLTTGLGSNDIGLDRGQLGNESIVKFRKAGNKLFLVQPNQKYRAVTANPAEKKSVEEAFARSVLFGFEIKEEKKGTYIIDLTPFLMQDAHGVSSRLQQGNHGSFSINKSKSALATGRTKAFPDNVEFEAQLAFDGEAKSQALRSVLPNSRTLAVTQHHSFIRLPDDGFKKRKFDPRSGAIHISYFDYSTPVHVPIEQRYVVKHRLEKKDPEAAVSEAVKPIVYYLDPGTPEPVRTALLEGAAWWNEAYEAIGFKNAFQVKMLPEDADPMDVRYNVIQWVHRSTRGWSYGASVVDPRTGEIIKGHVSLGSLRIRQDFMIAQALLEAPFAENDENHSEIMEMALARIRQLSAHEVGHTIGFAHNFAASAAEDASVMDYPHPKITLKDGKIRINEAYTSGIGEWDKFTVKYSYAEIPENTSEEKFLNAVLSEATARGLQFISDSDARAAGGAHIKAHLWDNNKAASEELERVLEIRKKAVSTFSPANIRTGEPYSVLEDVFVPLYFFHRYQTEAAVKLIGGLDYNYAVRGGDEQVLKVLPVAAQKQTLKAVLKTLEPETLAIPKDKLELFPPRAYGYSRSRESFRSNTGVTFDVLGAPATSADMTLSFLLHPERAARLVQQKALDQNQLGLQEVLDELFNTAIKPSHKDPYLQEVQNTVAFASLRAVMGLAAHKDAVAQVQAISHFKIEELSKWLRSNQKKNPVTYSYLLRQIEEFREDPSDFRSLPAAPKIPDGSPIGSFQCGF